MFPPALPAEQIVCPSVSGLLVKNFTGTSRAAPYVQNSIRLPLAGLAPPRVLMCSASMGAEGSVTLQLREAVQAPDATGSLDGALTIGYPDPELLADMLGTFQGASTGAADPDATGPFELLQDSNGSTKATTDKTSVTTATNLLSHGTVSSSSVNNGSTSSNSGTSSSSSSSSNNLSPSSTAILHHGTTMVTVKSAPSIGAGNGGSLAATSPTSLVLTTVSRAETASGNSSASSSPSAASSPGAVSLNGLGSGGLVKKPRPKTVSPTRHGPQQCQSHPSHRIRSELFALGPMITISILFQPPPALGPSILTLAPGPRVSLTVNIQQIKKMFIKNDGAVNTFFLGNRIRFARCTDRKTSVDVPYGGEERDTNPFGQSTPFYCWASNEDSFWRGLAEQIMTRGSLGAENTKSWMGCDRRIAP
uniref:Uncharacterized protein n=1 Tax=Anopheles farauti TaxID=69004 RepID=A0A182Q956_9DIPT